jgi:large subunit ribosomal protein L1
MVRFHRKALPPEGVPAGKDRYMPDQVVVDAVKKVCESSAKREFAETLELSINLKDIDLSTQANRLDTEIILPKGRGRPVKVAIFASKEMAEKASGTADMIITQDMLTDLIGNKRKMKKLADEISFFIADMSMMPTIGRSLGGVLGPRGKMPKPLPQTADPISLIKSLKSSVKVRTRDKMTFHVAVGTRNMPPEAVAENIEEVLARITSKLARGEHNIRSIYLKSTMGEAVPIPIAK